MDPVTGYKVEKPAAAEVHVNDQIVETTYPINNLIPGQYYRVKVSAVNGEGQGTPGEKVIKTKTGKLLSLVVVCLLQKQDS